MFARTLRTPALSLTLPALLAVPLAAQEPDPPPGNHLDPAPGYILPPDPSPTCSPPIRTSPPWIMSARTETTS